PAPSARSAPGDEKQPREGETPTRCPLTQSPGAHQRRVPPAARKARARRRYPHGGTGPAEVAPRQMQCEEQRLEPRTSASPSPRATSSACSPTPGCWEMVHTIRWQRYGFEMKKKGESSCGLWSKFDDGDSWILSAKCCGSIIGFPAARQRWTDKSWACPASCP
uniref:Uncharacterized protein n=1 Tax=Aegilops tauschii subsp. strangulata TaxID=200361 RepID=A0A453AGK1_AEGTS